MTITGRAKLGASNYVRAKNPQSACPIRHAKLSEAREIVGLRAVHCRPHYVSTMKITGRRAQTRFAKLYARGEIPSRRV